MAGDGGEDLNKKFNELITSLQEPGILDDYFDELKGLQDEKSPDFVTTTIATYLGGAVATVAELGQNLQNEPKVNYQKVNYLADKLKGSSMCIGGSRLADVCAELCDASEANKREACLALFEGVNREYSILQGSLNQIVQLDRAIHDKNNK